MKKSTKEILGAGAVVVAVVVAGAIALAPKTASAATPQQLPAGNKLPGLGAPLLRAGMTVFVTGDAQTPEDGAFLLAVTGALAAQRPDITFAPIPLRVVNGVLDLSPVEAAAAAADKGSQIGDPIKVGVLWILTPGDVGVRTPAEAFFDSIAFVEVVPQGLEFNPGEADWIRAHRTSTARTFGLISAVDRTDPSKFARALLADVTNANGMPAGRSV